MSRLCTGRSYGSRGRLDAARIGQFEPAIMRSDVFLPRPTAEQREELPAAISSVTRRRQDAARRSWSRCRA